MWRNSFLRFHRSAEAAGYPALLVVTLVSGTIIVSAIVLLALMNAAWAVVFAFVCLGAALTLLSGGLDAAFHDEDEDEPSAKDAPPEVSHVVSLRRKHRDATQDKRDRHAA